MLISHVNARNDLIQEFKKLYKRYNAQSVQKNVLFIENMVINIQCKFTCAFPIECEFLLKQCV